MEVIMRIPGYALIGLLVVLPLLGGCYESSGGRCGDGVCRGSETCATCPGDCGDCTDVCGDGICSGAETCRTCPVDCGSCSACGDGSCTGGETCTSCPYDCGTCPPVCGNGICESIEWCASCPADCGVCSGSASVAFSWMIHNVAGGSDVAWGSGTANEICQLVQALEDLASPPGVQLWVDETGDGVADTAFYFDCQAGSGLTTEEWEAGESLTYAFALVDSNGMLLSQSMAWESVSLRGGVNDLGAVNFYIGDYGPLEVELLWADKIDNPAFGSCDFPPDSVAVMGYLLCWGPLSGGRCPEGMLYDEVDIGMDPARCLSELVWEVTDFGAYTLLIDGEDIMGITIWGMECQDLVVDSFEPSSNAFVCQVYMTASP
jgi:hypothetical protein